MEADPSFLSFNVALAVLFVDILLSGDNAIVIALACRSLGPAHRIKAMWLGIAGAFVARLLLTGVATMAMSIPLLRLIGGCLLLKISIELIVDNFGKKDDEGHSTSLGSEDIFTAAKTIVLADIVMSLDNVLALSAVTHNNFPMLIAGLLVSIPILMFGSLLISRTLDEYPRLLWLGGALLGAVSGSLIIEDPVFGDIFVSPSSVASLLAPLLAAVYTVLQSKIIIRNQIAIDGSTLKLPPSLGSIFWNGNRKKPKRQEALLAKPQPVEPQVMTQSQRALNLEATDSLADRAIALNSPPAKKRETLPRSWTEKPVQSTLIFAMILLAFWGVNLLLDTRLMPTPEGFRNYKCNDPALTISYREDAKNIRLTSGNNVVTTTVGGNQIVWNEYRASSQLLGVPLPTKIVSVSPMTLIVDGGMFQKTICSVVSNLP